MGEPFYGEIRIVSFPFAPKGWARCEGQLLQISQNQALFSILGTSFGGDGVRTFALPDLRGRAPMHPDASRFVGTTGGEEGHALTIAEMPPHSHPLMVSSGAATSPTNSGNVLATAPASLGDIYAPQATSASAPMAADAVGFAGNGDRHENMQPFLVLTFVIALTGIFPTQN